MHYIGHSRYICLVLQEMRDLIKATAMREGAKDTMYSLVEEAQIMANRMEAGLDDNKTMESAHKNISKLRKQIDSLESKRDGLSDDPSE